MKIGIIGCGNIGTEIAEFIDSNDKLNLDYIHDVSEDNINNLLSRLENNKPEQVFFEDLIEKSDLIIEAANKDVALKIIEETLEKEKKIIIMSTGGLLSCIDDIYKSKSEIFMPSGAICGLDGVKSASMDDLECVMITTTKPPKGLSGAPYIENNNIDLDEIKKKQVIFEGDLNKAIDGFPKNINVGATLFLASRFKDLKVRIVADPDGKTNVHEIYVKGKFGSLETKVENLPSKNPKTSYLAILSAKRVLQNMIDNVKVGN